MGTGGPASTEVSSTVGAPSGAPGVPGETPPRLTMVISSLVMGGAERVMTELANHWAARDWPITLIHYSEAGTPPAYPLDRRVVEVPLGLFRVSRTPISAVINNVRRVSALRMAIRDSRPEIVLSFMANVNTLLATTGMGLPVLVSEHRGPRGELNLAWTILREVTYRRAAAVVMLTESALAQLSPALRRRGRVVPNPLPASFASAEILPEPAEATATPADPLIVGMGRLGPEKGFDLLIAAFARVAATWPTARLVIWGEGDERGALEAIVASHGLNDRVTLPGTTTSPEQELCSATIFVLSSRKEGLPMVLIEAMALGRAVVAADCEHGPRDVIRDGIDGILVPPDDVPALTAAIEGLLQDAPRRATLGRRAVEVRERFTIQAVATRWEALFRQAIDRR